MKKLALGALILVALFAVVPDTANAGSITYDLGCWMTGGTCTGNYAIGTISFIDNDTYDYAVDLEVALLNDQWKLLATAFNYDDDLFPPALPSGYETDHGWFWDVTDKSIENDEDSVKFDSYAHSGFDLVIPNNGNIGATNLLTTPYVNTITLQLYSINKKGEKISPTGEYFDLDYSYFDFLSSGTNLPPLHVAAHIGSYGDNGQYSIFVGDSKEPGGGEIPVPEPASLLLIGAGLIGISVAARRRRR